MSHISPSLPAVTDLRPLPGSPLIRALFMLGLMVAAGLVPIGHARAAGPGPSGLPLPRFVTTGSDRINVRVGPGERYNIAWVYVKEGTPVEIIQEFDTWRKIRDADGQEGWVHSKMLSGRRAGITAPGEAATQIPLLSRAGDANGIRAYLGSGFRVDISKCDGSWCEVSATTHPKSGNGATYSGYLQQAQLWGVYPDEEFD
jgi:SH3-like domain-containing protein